MEIVVNRESRRRFGSHSVDLFVPLQECCVKAPIKARFDSKIRVACNKRESTTLDVLPIMDLLGSTPCIAEHDSKDLVEARYRSVVRMQMGH